MKKLLIGTTALIAASAIANGAQSASKIKLGVGGYFLAFIVGGEQDADTFRDAKGKLRKKPEEPGKPGSKRRSYDVEREAEIIFNGSTKLDNGITVGAQVQLEAETCGDQIDETFIYFSGGFGRINIGSENSAPYLMHYASPAPSHWAHGLNSPDFRHVNPNGNSIDLQTSRQQLSGDNEKITYFSPRFGGVQLGVSYTPDGTEETSSYAGFTSNNDVNQHSDVIEISANFVRKVGGVNLAFSAGYGHGSNENPALAKGAVSGVPAVPETDGIGTPGTEGYVPPKDKVPAVPAKLATFAGDDRQEWSVGASVNFSGLTIGAGYRNDDNGATQAQNMNLGVRYARAAWGFGVQGAYVISEIGSKKDEYFAVEVGGSYDLGPGVNVNAGVQWHEYDSDAADGVGKNEAIIFFIGTALSF